MLLLAVLAAVTVLFVLKCSKTTLRSTVTPWLVARVEADVAVNAAFQRLRSALLTAAVDGSAATVSIEMYVATIPTLYWSGHRHPALVTLLTLAAASYGANFLKVRAQSPRPAPDTRAGGPHETPRRRAGPALRAAAARDGGWPPPHARRRGADICS